MTTRGRTMFLFALGASLLACGLVVYADSVNITTYLRTRNAVENNGRTGKEHLLEDENVNITDTFLANHTEQSGGGTYGDNMAFADFWYDSIHRRVHGRSIDLKEIDDPVDVRIVRVPGSYPNTPNHGVFHGNGTVFGYFGFSQWRTNSNGAGSYFGALQGRIINDASNGFTNNTGHLELATASGTNDDQPQFGPDDLQPRLRVSPDGTVTIGPQKVDDPNFTHRGRLVVNSRSSNDVAVDVTQGWVRSGTGFCIGGDCRSSWPTGGGGTTGSLSCTNRVAFASGTEASVQCLSGETATGGGGGCDNGALRNTRPAGNGWEITCSSSGTNRVEAMCCSIR